jgi:nitroimidazol reductase NimA-like FMN-containing flavoprotein (pyridoxamine 5'-phosphate oxidase superfamily)
MTKQSAPTDRTRLRRMPDKAAHNKTTIHTILDVGPVAHVGYIVNGAPHVTPTLQWREGDRVFWHGSAASRFLRAIDGTQACLTVTLTDGLVLARSAFEHSITYRSVMIFGAVEAVTDPAEKEARLKAMMDQMFPGRWPQLRPMTGQELKATTILTMPIDEASAKIATGMPDDPPEDRAWSVWAGIVPVITILGTPEPAPDCVPGTALPQVKFG